MKAKRRQAGFWLMLVTQRARNEETLRSANYAVLGCVVAKNRSGKLGKTQGPSAIGTAAGGQHAFSQVERGDSRAVRNAANAAPCCVSKPRASTAVSDALASSPAFPDALAAAIL